MAEFAPHGAGCSLGAPRIGWLDTDDGPGRLSGAGVFSGWVIRPAGRTVGPGGHRAHEPALRGRLAWRWEFRSHGKLGFSGHVGTAGEGGDRAPLL